jgi:enoyl-[acyl-carrier protein] reductase I
MYDLLKGKKGIIFGALNDRSIAWKVAQRAHAEGARLVLTNTPVSLRLGQLQALAEECSAKIVAADATSMDDLNALVEQSLEHFGGKIDFVLHSIGMSPNVRKSIPYEDINYAFMQKTIDISALSFHKMMNVLYNKDAMACGGSIVALTYIAGERAFPGYSDMADAKAMLESVARGFGLKFGRKCGVRVNTVSQSPTLTTAGEGIAGMSDMYRYADKFSPLGNASAEDCADYVVTLFSDLTRKVTMQNLYHDGGFSATGLTEEVLEAFSRGL